MCVCVCVLSNFTVHSHAQLNSFVAQFGGRGSFPTHPPSEQASRQPSRPGVAVWRGESGTREGSTAAAVGPNGNLQVHSARLNWHKDLSFRLIMWKL